MELSDEQYREMEGWAECFFSTADIALIMRLDAEDLVDEFEVPGSRVHDAIMRGRLKAEGAVRKTIFDLARSGSAPAQTLAMKIIEQNKLDERLR